jgi:neutral ceramidase
MIASTGRYFLSRVGLAVVVLGLLLLNSGERTTCLGADRVLRAGAVAIDVTPLKLPVIINGSMIEKTADKIVDRLHARCLVLDDGTTQVAIVVVDSCMMPRKLLDHAKQLASQATGIPTNRMLISATHAHSVPSVHGCLGTSVDTYYAQYLPGQIAKGIVQAHAALVPARIGWAFGRDEKNVACRRWLMKPGVAPTNPFGGTSNDRAQMHPGHNNPNAIRATGPVDPDVPVVALQTRDGKPLAFLSAYSVHYVSAPAISADYFGVFCNEITAQLAADQETPRFVSLLANATSGDAWLQDYTRKTARTGFDRFSVGKEVSQAALKAYQQIRYYDWVPIVMEEKKLTLNVRLPDDAELARARKVVKSFAGRKPMTNEEVYAREAVLLREMSPTRELKLQALRLGDLGITAIPNEVFASTGLDIKRKSPLKQTFTIELANGCEGYIPPPDQHALGGYTTWRARTSCLEVNAEPKIQEAVLDLLKQVDKQRRDEPARPSTGAGR